MTTDEEIVAEALRADDKNGHAEWDHIAISEDPYMYLARLVVAALREAGRLPDAKPSGH